MIACLGCDCSGCRNARAAWLNSQSTHKKHLQTHVRNFPEGLGAFCLHMCKKLPGPIPLNT